MNARMLTGLSLIVGPIVMWIGFLGFGATIGNVDWGDASEMIPALAENAGAAKSLILLATLGMLIVVVGFAGLNHSMSEGSGAHYMRMGLLLYIIGTTVVIGESALSIETAEAASNGNQGAAESLFAAAGAIGSTGEAIRFLGFALIGVSIFTQKNLHVALGALMLVIGLLGTGSAVSVYYSPIMMIGYVGSTVLMLATGILVMRARD